MIGRVMGPDLSKNSLLGHAPDFSKTMTALAVKYSSICVRRVKMVLHTKDLYLLVIWKCRQGLYFLAYETRISASTSGAGKCHLTPP